MKKQKISISTGTNLLLRAAILGISGIVIFFSSFILSDVYRNWSTQSPELSGWKYPIILVIGGAVLTFFVALGQIWRLLGLVEKNKAFSVSSVKAMRNVKYCGLVMSGLFVILLPLVFHAAQNDDAPGLILLYGSIFICVPFVVAILAGVAQKLFQNAIDIKNENDLTV